MIIIICSVKRKSRRAYDRHLGSILYLCMYVCAFVTMTVVGPIETQPALAARADVLSALASFCTGFRYLRPLAHTTPNFFSGLSPMSLSY